MRYADYLPDGDDAADKPDPRDATYVFRQAVIITFLAVDDVWDAVFIEDGNNGGGNRTFSNKEDAIAWARQRCDYVRVQIKGTSEYEVV